jgi:hypothetical protein
MKDINSCSSPTSYTKTDKKRKNLLVFFKIYEGFTSLGFGVRFFENILQFFYGIMRINLRGC